MLRRNLFLALGLALALAPVLAAAQDGEWEDDDGGGWSAPPAAEPADPGSSVTFDSFYGALSPYGEWIDAPQYGRVWRPNVAVGWRPYYYGRWEWTNEGWLWVSDEPWGWAAYHYGRWAYDPGYGWLWVPGYEWAPAWVSWRFDAGVVGWAPLMPGFSVYVTSYPFYAQCWTFVPVGGFVGVPVYSVAYAPAYTARFYRQTIPAPPRGGVRPMPGGRSVPAPAWGGPAPRFIAERTGRPVNPVRVVPSARPFPGAVARNGAVPIYRPDAFGPRGGGRGPGAFPAPGVERRGGGAPAPVWRGGGRGPGAFPAPGLERRGGGAPAPVWRGGAAAPGGFRGGGAPAPVWRGGAAAPGGFRGGGFAPRAAAPAAMHGAPARAAPRGHR